MRKILLSGFALALLSVAPAIAADLKLKAPPKPVVPAFTWTGFYVGGNVGAAINNSSFELDPSGCFVLGAGCGVGGLAANPFRTFAGSLRQSAFTGGGQVGYNQQFGSVVAGIETDLNYDGISQSITMTPALSGPLLGAFPVVGFSQKLDWFGTLRARLGFAPADRWLVYATGGLAYGHVSSTTNVLFPRSCCGGDNYVGSTSSTRAGWTAGGGVEWAFINNWSAKLEYIYVDLGSFNYLDPIINAAALGFPTNVSYTTNETMREHVVRVGVNRHL
ncbi:MAG TPA: outer membrane protein [Xanthobacteraceae bacterium]